MTSDNSIEDKPKKVYARDRYKDRIVCTLCNKSLSLKCLKYTHKCSHEDAPAREKNTDYFVTYYLEKDKADLSCPVCNVKYQCFTSLTKHLNRNRECKLKRLHYYNPDTPKTEIELLRKFGTRDVKNIMSCETEEKREELLKPFYQPPSAPSPPYERVFAYSFHNDWEDRDIGCLNQ